MSHNFAHYKATAKKIRGPSIDSCTMLCILTWFLLFNEHNHRVSSAHVPPFWDKPTTLLPSQNQWRQFIWYFWRGWHNFRQNSKT